MGELVDLAHRRTQRQLILRTVDSAMIEFGSTGQLGLLADPEMKARLVEVIRDDLLEQFGDLFADGSG